MNWETVATSTLTSGGILFAAYKIWFQRRLEDHKLALQNNGKLFELEIKALEDLGKLIQESLDTELGVPAKFPESEILIMKSYEISINLKKFKSQNFHALSKDMACRINGIIKSLTELQESAETFSVPNRSYCNGRYKYYENIPDPLLTQSSKVRTKFIEAYDAFKAEIYNRAGRKT